MIALFSDTTSYFLFLQGISNLWLGDIFFLVQFLVLLRVFNSIITIKTIFFLIPAVIVSTILLLDLFKGKAFNQMETDAAAISSLVLIGLSVLFFYQTLEKMPTDNIYKYPPVWIAVGTILYYSVSLLVFLLYNYLLAKDVNLNITLWTLHNFLNVAKNTFFSVALWLSIASTR